MSKPSFDAIDRTLSAAALRLAASKGWEETSLEDIARSAKIPLTKLKTRFKTSSDLVPVIAKVLDREAFQGKKFSGAPRDKLFDILMARFDVLQKHKAAILSMAAAAKGNRKLFCVLAQTMIEGCYRIVDTAKLDRPRRPILVLGLMALYSSVFWVWCQDKSRDMAKTMAALDRALRLSDKAAPLFNGIF